MIEKWVVKEKKKSETKEVKDLIAKKDFWIRHNEYERVIKKGDDLSDVPKLYHENLKTEGIL